MNRSTNELFRAERVLFSLSAPEVEYCKRQGDGAYKRYDRGKNLASAHVSTSDRDVE